MNILLIDPPFHRLMQGLRYYYPLGLTYLAAVLKKSGHDVVIYDAERAVNLTSATWLNTAENYDSYINALDNDIHPIWNECRAILTEFDPEVVGISALSVKSASALKIATICKTYNPTIKVVVGADHPTACPEDFLKTACVDFVVRGEGERALLELVTSLETKATSYRHIGNLSYKDGVDIVHNAAGSPIQNLDEIPFPARSALRTPTTYRPVDFGLMMTSRGCPMKCTFCGVSTVWGTKTRFRSCDNIITEMKEIIEMHGTRYFSFRDASFTLNRNRIMTLCKRMISEKLEVGWECLTRNDLLDNEILRLMKNAGCQMIRVGIESGSQPILDYLRKGITLDKMRAGARLLRQLEISWSAYFMFGVPIETSETMAASVKFMKELDPDFITVSRYAPIPGTELYNDLVKRGRIAEQIDWRWECNQNIKTCFVDGMSAHEFGNIMTDVARMADEHNRTHGWKDNRW